MATLQELKLLADAIGETYNDVFRDRLNELGKQRPLCTLVTNNIRYGIHYTPEDARNYGALREMNNLMERWPKFSGDRAYPVPVALNKRERDAWRAGVNEQDERNLERHSSASVRFNRAINSDEDMYDPDTPYGRARRSLLRFLYNQTKGNKWQSINK